MRENKDINILVVDDEEILRMAIALDFKRKGFTVFEACNGAEAFNFVKNNKVDLILSDVRMPGGDGIELLNNVKNLNPGLPILMFITGFADMSLEDAYDKGADAVFAKPFDRKALMAAVMKAVSDKYEAWGRKTERTDSNFKIDLSFPELKLEVQGRLLNIGRGGIFVALTGPTFPRVNDKAEFKIQFTSGKLTSIEGSGTVRWSRSQGNETRSPGCGIEFDFLSDENRRQVVELINALKTKAFIPKS